MTIVLGKGLKKKKHLIHNLLMLQNFFLITHALFQIPSLKYPVVIEFVSFL